MMGIWEIVQEWLMAADDRKIEFSHGGDGGKWYANVIDAGESYDGVGHTANEALQEAWATFLAAN